MRVKLIKLAITIAVIVLSAFLCFVFYKSNGYSTRFFLLGTFGIVIPSVIFLFLWIDLGNRLRQSSSFGVYVLTAFFFGIPQFLLGLVYIAFTIVSIFPLGLFTLHKTLPKGWAHIQNAFTWPGDPEVKKQQNENSLETLAQNMVYKPLDRKSKKNNASRPQPPKKSQEEKHMDNTANVDSKNNVFPAMPALDVHDYASYLDQISKK